MTHNLRHFMDAVTMYEADTTSLRFKAWFQGSQVVDQHGDPLVCYHGTDSAGSFDQFRPLSHFGTAKAANAIVDNKKMVTASIMPVYLSINQPLRFTDLGGYTNSLITDVVKSTNPSLWSDIPSKELEWMQAEDTDKCIRYFIDHLRDFDYDGLAYVNDAEDRGSMSWVIFDAKQVWPIYTDHDEDPHDELLRLAMWHHTDKTPADLKAQVARVDDASLPTVLAHYRKLVAHN